MDDQKDYLEFLQEYPSLNVPLDVFLHVVPKLSHSPRYYTISSSSQVQKNMISITVVISNAQKPRGRVYNGIVTNYLAKLKPSKKTMICCFVRPSTFRLPRNLSTPIIMVGPGTGIAPFRAFIQEATQYQSAKGS